MNTNKNSVCGFKTCGYKIVNFKFVTNHLHTLLIILLFLFSRNSYGQLTTSTIKEEYDYKISMRADTSVHITSFTARAISEKNYLKWIVSGLRYDGVFIVYHSCDGINYSEIGSKPAIGVPAKLDIAYYFNCNVSDTGDHYYRIVYLDNQQSTYLTWVETYLCDEKLLASQTR